ncbi:hypothetical protein HDU78_009734, partial [Chytriomyces hyalinus]
MNTDLLSAGSVPTSVTQWGKCRRGIGEQQEAQAMGSTSGNDWDDGFEDNDGAGDSAGNQDYETGNNADDEFDLDEAVN